MTTTKKRQAIVLLCMAIIMPMSAQQKLFTLEDLNFGGTNFHNMRPKSMFLTWWGNQLMYQDAEEGGTIDRQGTKKPLFNIAELGAEWHSAMNAQYPYAGQPLVLLSNKQERILYDFRKKAIVWRQEIKQGDVCQKWSKSSRALAFIRDAQLYVRDA